jgi:VWFA-related protein
MSIRGRRWLAAVGVSTVLAGILPGFVGEAQTPRFRTGVDVVIVEATVLDRDGAAVADLGPADFAVEIDGRAREVVAADFVRHENAGSESIAANPDVTANQAAASGRTIVIVIDHVGLRSEGRAVLQTAKAWLSTLGPTDRVGLIALPQPGINIELTTDHTRIAQGLDTIVPHPNPPPPFSNRNISGWEAVRMWEGDQFVTGEVLRRECRGGDPSCEGEIKMQIKSRQLDMQSTVLPIVRSLEGLVRGLRAVPGPKHLVLLSSGWLMSERDAATEMTTVAREAALANATVHTFTSEQWSGAAARSRPNMNALQETNLQMSTVETLSGMTGGRAVRLPGQADLAFAALSAGLGGYYRLGVRALPEDLDGKARKISTKLLRRGLTIANTRRILAASASPTAKALASGDPQTVLRAALESPAPELGLDVRAAAYVTHADAGIRDVRVVVVGDVGRAAAGPAVAVAALYDLAGRPASAMENVVEVAAAGAGPLTIELTVPAALYVLRVAVRDAAGHVGSLERPVDARWKKVGAIETPGLVLFRSALGAQTPSGLVLDSIRHGEQLISQLTLAPSADRATPIVFEVTRPGDPAPAARRRARIAETTAGVLVVRDALPTVTLPPGRYTMTARIGDGSASVARAFRIVAADGEPGGPRPAAAAVP